MTSLVRKSLVPFVVIALAFAFTDVSWATTHDIVAFSGFTPGTIVVKTSERRLYFVIDNNHALRFPVGVGCAGMTWTGTARIEGKFVRPAWSPPEMIRREKPRLPAVSPGGATYNP